MAEKKVPSNNPMVKVIEEGMMGIYETTNVLARLWRILLYDNNLKAHQWHTLISKAKFHRKGEMTEKAAATDRGNATRMLAKSKISWGMFMRGLIILEYDKMDIKVTLWRKNKPQTLEISVDNLRDISNEDDGEEE